MEVGYQWWDIHNPEEQSIQAVRKYEYPQGIRQELGGVEMGYGPCGCIRMCEGIGNVEVLDTKKCLHRCEFSVGDAFQLQLKYDEERKAWVLPFFDYRGKGESFPLMNLHGHLVLIRTEVRDHDKIDPNHPIEIRWMGVKYSRERHDELNKDNPVMTTYYPFLSKELFPEDRFNSFCIRHNVPTPKEPCLVSVVANGIAIMILFTQEAIDHCTSIGWNVT